MFGLTTPRSLCKSIKMRKSILHSLVKDPIRRLYPVGKNYCYLQHILKTDIKKIFPVFTRYANTTGRHSLHIRIKTSDNSRSYPEHWQIEIRGTTPAEFQRMPACKLSSQRQASWLLWRAASSGRTLNRQYYDRNDFPAAAGVLANSTSDHPPLTITVNMRSKLKLLWY